MHVRAHLLLLILLVAGPGCAKRYLVATPNLLHTVDPQLAFANTPAQWQRPDMDILYATDRAPVENSKKMEYGSGRARSLAYGSATVDFSPKLTWQELTVDTTKPDGKREAILQLADFREVGRINPFSKKLSRTDDGLQLAGGANNGYLRPDEAAGLHDLLRQRLEANPSKDVFVFIHGFNNSFQDAVFRAGEVWHFLGRVGVPVAYSWPAGRGGLLGYAYDRESGEFTVTHLKQFLLHVASCPEVERVHIIAHSRGTDVAISALREIHIGYQAQGRSTPEALKLENLVLAAPDLDEDVFVQRFVAEDLLKAARRTTIYASRRDRALEAADFIFSGRKRIGALGPRDFSPQVRQALAKMPELQFIEVQPNTGNIGHAYIFEDPAALSDLILLLRDRRSPGRENGRPLIQQVQGIWELTGDYPGKR